MSSSTTNEAGASSALDVIEVLIQSNEKVITHRDVFSRIVKRLLRIKTLLKENNNINIDTKTFERVLIELEFTCSSVQNFIKQQEIIIETCVKKHEEIKKQTEELLHNILSRLVKHEVDLTHDHQVKLQIHSEAIFEQHSFKKKAFSEEMKRRTEEEGPKMKANAQKQLVNLHKQYAHIIEPYLKRSLDLHGTVPINGAEASVVGRVVESLYEISSIQRDILERIWKKFEMPLDYIPTQLRVDTSTSYERKAARQMVMDDHRLPFSMFSKEKPPGNWKQRLLAAPYMPSMVERDRLLTEKDDESIEIKDILREHRWIVILGDPGTGKTSFVQWLSASYVRALLINQNELEFGPARIPIVIRIGEFADALRKNIDLTLFDYVGGHRWFGKSMYYEGESSTISQKLTLALQDYVRQGQALIILDGLDEIVVSDERIRLVNLVESFVDTYVQTPSHNSVFDERFFGEVIDKPAEFGGNQLVVTSRIVGYHAAPLSGQFVHYIIKKMDLEHINAFVDNWFKKIHIEIIRVLSTIEISIDDSQNRWEEQANNLKVELSNPIQIGLQELSSNACLLSFICSIAFGSQETSLPSQRILLYEKTVNAMIDSWKNKDTNDTTIQGSKVITMFCDIACYIHMHSAAGLIEETKLKELCIQSLHSYEGKKEPTNEDFIRVENDAIHFVEVIRRDVGVLAERGESFYGFLHLTFQEYFVCLDLINVTKYRRIFASSSEETLSDAQVIARSLHHHINDPRFRVPIALSFGRLSSKWRKKSDTLDSLCSEFLKFDSSSSFPICALFLINSINDFVLQPSPDILIKALDRLLITAGSNQWYLENSMLCSQMKDIIHKLPDNIINKWIRSVLSQSSCKNIHTVAALSQFIVKEHEDTLQIKGMDVSTCELLTPYLSHDNENNNFAIDILFIRISITNHKLLPMASTGLEYYFMYQNIDIKTIHLSILALIITLYGGLRKDETKMTFDPSRMHRESSFVTPLIIQYLSNKSQSHAVKIIQFEKECIQRLSNIGKNDNLVEVVDALIAMLCIFGVRKLWTLPSLWSTTVFAMVLSRLKHVSMIIRQFYVVADHAVANDILASYLNHQLMTEIDSKDKNSQVSAHNVMQLVKANASAYARLRLVTKSSLLVNANYAEYRPMLFLPPSFSDNLLLKQLLSKNIILSSNQLSSSTLPEFVQLFWILEHLEDGRDDDMQDQMAMVVAANIIPSLLLFNHDSDPAFALAFVPEHVRALYFRLMEHYDILVNIQGSIKSHHKPILLFQHILIQSLMQLENSKCRKLSLVLTLCAMLPLLRIHGLENMVTRLTSKLTSVDKDYNAQIEFTKHRSIDFNTGQYTDGLTDLLNSTESYDNRHTHYEIVLTSIQEEKKRINDALLLLNSNSEDMDANSQLYSASVALSHVCWLSVDVEPSILFTEALEAASLITQPLLRFDALCSIGLISQCQPTTERLKNGYTLKEELERQLLQITADLHCTLHAAILLRCYSLCLQTDIVETSLGELLKKVKKADNFDQQVINRALFGTLRFNPVIRSHLLNSLGQQNDDSIELFEIKSSTFQRYFSNQTYNDDLSDDGRSVLLSSMFILELTSDTNLITEWLNSDTRSLEVVSSTENLQFMKQNKILTGSNLTYSQAVVIDQFLQSSLQSIDKQNFASLKDLSVELHSVSIIEQAAQGLVEGWLNFEHDLTLCSFAFHAALLLLQSNLWSIKAVDIVCNLLLDEQDRFRQRAEMIFKLDNTDQIQTSTQLTLEILLKLKECQALFRHKSPYAVLMCLRKQENIEINQRSHLDAIILLERQRILVTNMNMDNAGSYTLSPVLATVFESHVVKNILDVPFTSNLNQFSQDIIQYMCELIACNFSKFWSSDNSKQSIQERDLHDRFIERVIVALPMNQMNDKTNISMLIHSLTILVNNSTSSAIQQAAVYVLGFSTDENAVSYLFSILESVATNLFDDSHGYSNEVVSSAIRAYCYSVAKQEHDIHDNGQIEILRKLLEHPSVTISKAIRYGLGRVLNTTDLMKILKSNHVHCYEALLAGTADRVISDVSDRCVESTAALIEQYPDLLSIFVQELYENIRYFTDDIYYKYSMIRLYEYGYPHYVNVAASIAERMPAAFCTFVNEFVDGENLKRSLYYTSKQHDFPRRAACLTVLSMFGELTTDLCEMLVRALLDDPHLQNTCYRCISRIHSVKDEQVITKLKEYLKSKSSNARYASCKLLLHLSNKPGVISIKQVQNIFDEVMSDPQSTEDLWLIVEQEDTMADSIYYNAGQLKDAVHDLFINHLINDVNTKTSMIDKETNNLSVQQRDFIESEKATRLVGCLIRDVKKPKIDKLFESNDLVTSGDQFTKSSESNDKDDIDFNFCERDERHSSTDSSSTNSVEDNNQLDQLTPLINIEENNFFKLSDVNSSAKQAEIREACNRRAVEIHPNKNIVDTTRVFQAMKLNYEKQPMKYNVNIDSDKGEVNYDDNNNDEIYPAIENDQMTSYTGTKLSDIYKKQIDRYLTEYENLTFSNNFNEKLKEIITRAIETSASSIPVDNYTQCTICHQSCKDIHTHEREKYDPYEKIFNNVVTSISFEKIIDSNIWNWKPVERIVTHLPIWNIQQKQLSHFISQLKESVQIVCKSDRYWALLIDTYEQHKWELIKLPTILSQIVIVNYLPNAKIIRNLKNIFEKYDQNEQINIFSKIQKNDERITSGNYYLIDITTKNKYININDFCFPITDPPSEIYREYCYDCQKSFSFIERHHHCRMCGQQFCDDCMMYKRIPHLGYIIKPVRICHKCSDEKKYFIYQHLFTYVKNLIESKQFQYLNIYLALLYQYKTNENELFYRQTGVYCYQIEEYILALQCFTYARLSTDEWFQYAIEFCKKNQYLFSFTCIKLCNKPDEFWLEQANLQHSSTFALLCYEYIKISIRQLFEIAIEILSDDINACLSYLGYLNIKYVNQINWKEVGEEIFSKTNYNGSLAMFCFYLYDEMKNDEWNQIAEQLCNSNQFEKLSYLLSYLYHVQKIDFRASENTYIYFMTKILVHNHITLSLDDWLNDICYGWSLDIDRIVIGLSITYNYKYTSWIEYKNHYIERKEYFKTLICHKMAEYLTGNNETQWFINSIEDFDPVGYELYDSMNHSSDWKQLGDQYFKDEKFRIALNCYLFCENNEINQIIIQQAQSPLLPLSKALLYYTVVYKRIRGNNPKILSKNNGMQCNNIFYNICIVLYKQHNPYVLELVKSAISMYETDNPFKDTDLFKYHLIILNELNRSNDENGKNDHLINGGVHILFTFNNLSDESIHNLTSLNESLSVRSNTKVFTQLKSSTDKTCLQLTITLLNSKNYFLEQLKQLFQQCLGHLKLSEVRPPEYHSKMYLIQATILKLENKSIESLFSVHNAILSYPCSIVMFSAVLFMNHSYFHSTVRQLLTNDIRDKSLHLVDINPPTQMKNFNFLERTEDLIISKKYERAIIKQLPDNNPVQIALSYMDLNMVTSSNASLFPISLTMSCLHFYKAMMNPKCTSAELYAYRSIIFDLSIEIFLYTRHYLPLYVQMYIYKLLYTVILRSTDLFTKKIILTNNTTRFGDQYIIKDSHETLLDELLRNILQLSKVNPLTHAPMTSTIHNMVYMECVGNELLEMYLKLKSTNSTINQYYYFESVWKGWIDPKKFNDERRRCMQNFLNDCNWTMNDVENLLCWSLIPKTDDGWLFNTKHRLQLTQPAYSQVIGITLNNETGDIEFMFTQAKKNEHNLFDTIDIIDVLRNGITYANFTFDPPSKDYHSHPFYQMKYSPKRLSQAPNYLFTLLHVDYLLKMISTGVEICSFQPFEMRSSSENLMQRLPTYIREELQAIPIKSSRLITDSIHYFWIQPQFSIEYEQTYYKNFFGRENKNITQFYLNDDLKMCVKQYRIKYDKMGNSIDDENKTDDDQSAEAQFARIFTKYYDEIGKYFPELLRLKELCKLSILSRIIQAKYKEQCKFISKIETDLKLGKHLMEVKVKLVVSGETFNNSDEKTSNALSKILCKTYLCKESNLKPYLINWLKYDEEESLKHYLTKSLIEKKTKLKSTIEKLNFFFKDSDDNDNMISNDTFKCSWVPATFSFDLNMKIYGGINFNGNIRQVSGIKDMQEKTKSILRIDANNLYANLDKQKSNQMNSRKSKLRVDGSDTEKISSGHRSQRGGNYPKLPSNESNVKVTTHSKTKSEARRKALESNGLSPDAELFDTDEIDNKNKNTTNQLESDATINSKLVQEAYWHSDGYFVWLRPNSARTCNKRRPKGNTDVRPTQKAYFNVFFQKETGIEETEQHHHFDNED